jgi:putative holliday junction resolvase
LTLVRVLNKCIPLKIFGLGFNRDQGRASVRILGLDIGSKRIGIAVSDELGLTAQGLRTLTFTDTDSAIKVITNIATDYQVAEIVVGLPYNMDGTEGPQAERVRAIMESIKRSCDVPVVEWDERLSTVAAERVLLEADMSRSKRRKVIDKLAAVIILQGYLDRRWFGGAPNS